MADVEFHEPQYAPPPVRQKSSSLSDFVIKKGFAKDMQGAQRVMLITAALALLLVAVILVVSGSSGPSPEELEAEVMRG
ncbi:MAG TPA: hypothetical protein PK609_02550 [Candidatus Paceibacterota bacterium]|nr:hypothetical protein [Candidatus Paceibacterota bacterium]